ncbi:fungal protease inhibitor-1-like [Cylas formicarius]|uniref:fungal protease inhibitor-1-like n=1 Tax=Cylas formicarius TaxID=197179 RepID=UPI0029584258|nr:fungal protease inhibitor-1-like [Cylas formicarius]
MKLPLLTTVTTLLLVLILTVTCQEQLIVCPPDYCLTVKCVSDESCPKNETLVPTFCGCCRRCVPIIGEGGRCIIFNGVPPTSACDRNLTCCNGTCEKTCGE